MDPTSSPVSHREKAPRCGDPSVAAYRFTTSVTSVADVAIGVYGRDRAARGAVGGGGDVSAVGDLDEDVLTRQDGRRARGGGSANVSVNASADAASLRASVATASHEPPAASPAGGGALATAAPSHSPT